MGAFETQRTNKKRYNNLVCVIHVPVMYIVFISSWVSVGSHKEIPNSPKKIVFLGLHMNKLWIVKVLDIGVSKN